MSESDDVSPLRLTLANDQPIQERGRYVLYWMTAQRRTRFNHALQHAVSLSNASSRPLVVVEPLAVDHPWATERTHRFVIDGMRDNRAAFAEAGVRYLAHVESTPGRAGELPRLLADEAWSIVTDEYPCFTLRGLPQRMARSLGVRVEQVDGCGLMPLRANDRVFPRAHGFRRHLQRHLIGHLEGLPVSDPLHALGHRAEVQLPPAVVERFPSALPDAEALSRLAIDHRVGAVALAGGQQAAATQLARFVESRLGGYAGRNHPDELVTSGLSPWLHFGHVSSAEVLLRVAEHENWQPDLLSPSSGGARSGWWSMSEGAEGFLDQLVTWRELGFNMCFHRDDYDRYESLPEWALKTLAEHADDERPYLYELDELEAARTHDDIWNAAQRQLAREGFIHNYLRMLWGKRILEWAPSPRVALDYMIELNNRYAIDGRDPNSYSGIFWVLGRYDRAWGPERPIFGKVRYMSSANTRRKLRLKGYLARFGDD